MLFNLVNAYFISLQHGVCTDELVETTVEICYAWLMSFMF